MNNKNNILTADERAFYILQSIEGTLRIIEECRARYKKDGNISALKLALDGYLQVAETLKKIDHNYDYGK